MGERQLYAKTVYHKMIVLLRSSLNSLIASWGIWPQAATALFKTTKLMSQSLLCFPRLTYGKSLKKVPEIRCPAPNNMSGLSLARNHV